MAIFNRDGVVVAFFFFLMRSSEIAAECDLSLLANCENDPMISVLFFEDPCKYYKALENCIIPFQNECADNPDFALKLKDWDLAKGIFCASLSSCDLQKVQACFTSLDPALLNVSDPFTFGPFCDNGFVEFSQCFNELIPLCMSDEQFTSSGIIELVQMYDLICASTDGCNAYGLNMCSALLQDTIGHGSMIPESNIVRSLCNKFPNFSSCVQPKLQACYQTLQRKAYRFDFMVYQMHGIIDYMSITCTQYYSALQKYSSCYDTKKVQDEIDKCVSFTATEANVMEDLNSTCSELISNIECVHNMLTTECGSQEALVGSAYIQDFSLSSVTRTTGLTCPSPGFAEQYWENEAEATSQFTSKISSTAPPTRSKTTGSTTPGFIIQTFLPKSPLTTRLTTRLTATKGPTTKVPTTNVPTTIDPATVAPTVKDTTGQFGKLNNPTSGAKTIKTNTVFIFSFIFYFVHLI